MRTAFTIGLGIALTACSGRTPAGSIGHAPDLREYLPDSLRTIRSAATDTAFHVGVKVGPDSAPITVSWTTGQRGAGRYLVSVSAQLESPVNYDSLRFGEVRELQNLGSRGAPIEAATVEIAWFRRRLFWAQSGLVNVGIDALGRRTLAPARRR